MFHENKSIYILSILLLLLFISWLWVIWFTNYLPQDINKVQITVTSITATLAPIALLITLHNYLRKSGMDLRVKLGLVIPKDKRSLGAHYIMSNHKDKSIFIPILYAIINDEYVILINSEGFSIPPYAIENKRGIITDIIKTNNQAIDIEQILNKNTKYKLGIDTFSEGSFVSEPFHFSKPPGPWDNPARMFKTKKNYNDYKKVTNL